MVFWIILIIQNSKGFVNTLYVFIYLRIYLFNGVCYFFKIMWFSMKHIDFIRSWTHPLAKTSTLWYSVYKLTIFYNRNKILLEFKVTFHISILFARVSHHSISSKIFLNSKRNVKIGYPHHILMFTETYLRNSIFKPATFFFAAFIPSPTGT